MTEYRAAWVPDDDPARPWEDAAAMASQWIHEQARELRSEPLLLTYSFQNGEGIRAFAGLQHATTRSRASVTGPAGRPVLAYVPEERVMTDAHLYTRRAALCAVETVSFPLHGWARAAGAINLLSGQVLPALDSAVKPLLEHLQFIGNNGWGDQYGKRDATRLLPEIRQHVDRSEVLGYVIAHGAHDGGIRNLQKIMDKLGWKPGPTY